MNQTIVKMQKQQTRLEQELKEKESELEDLGCWRALLAKVLNITSIQYKMIILAMQCCREENLSRL